jgi:peroxiredoxin
MLRMRASRSLALTSVFARGMAISVGDAFPKGVSVQVNFKENLPIESLTSKGNVLMVSLPGAFTPT